MKIVDALTAIAMESTVKRTELSRQDATLRRRRRWRGQKRSAWWERKGL